MGEYLRTRGWLAEGDAVTTVERAGEGNMNLVLRASTTERRLILKQGRPWVEKYAHIPAPWDRTLVEGTFYAVAGRDPRVRSGMPALLGIDEQSRILVLEDVIGARDLTGMYGGERLAPAERATLVAWLRALHRVALRPDEQEALANRAMRALNHEHIFRFPLDPSNGLDLDAITPGLGELARRLQAHEWYVSRVRALGETYLATGRALVHGDYFPGSWLRGPGGIRVIDPEFAFIGPPEFDLGVMAAHLLFSGEAEIAPEALANEYGEVLDLRLVRAFAGVELMRRIIGVAQLPIARDLRAKRRLLTLSESFVVES